ncbi:Pentatricopeptide repeat-containing protein At3g02330, mitochondrial [Linum grandiflorum]
MVNGRFWNSVLSQFTTLFLHPSPCNKALPFSFFSTTTTLKLSSSQLPQSTKLTFCYIYRECSLQNSLNPGKQAHARMIVSGFLPTTFVSNCLVQMYVKCSKLCDANKVFNRMTQRDVVTYNAMIFAHAGCGKMAVARELFDEMPARDVVSWNSMISGFLQNGEHGKAIDVVLEMGRSDVKYDRTTFAVALKVCAGLEDCFVGVQLHGLAVQLGLVSDVYTGSAMLDMYAKCNRLDDSLKVFREIPEKNWVSWSAMIAGFIQNNRLFEGLELFNDMQRTGIGVSQSIYATVFRSCAGLSALDVGSQFHCHSIKSDFGADVIVGTATLDMYAKCGCMGDAYKLFNSMRKHNLQSYNAIIVGYARSGQGSQAMLLFRRLLKSGLGFDEISLSGAFCACASIREKLLGLQLHGLMMKTVFRSDVCVANAVLDMYGKCGALVEATCVFDEMMYRDAVSWNAIIAANEQNGSGEEDTLPFLASMLSFGMEPDEFTYGSVLKACAAQQCLNSGREIHGRIIKSGLGWEPFVGGALVDMYCKCGLIKEAEKIHDRTYPQSMVSWNAIVSGFSLMQQSEEAQSFFLHMLEAGVQPDNFTYATVLDTCANLATLGLGMQIHGQVIKQKLQSDVYISSTLVDMYSKCGKLLDSELMYEKAPNKDLVAWNSLICGYSQHGHGEKALEIFEMRRPENVNPNHATFLSVLRACAHKEGLIDKGLLYFDIMKTEYRLDPELEHYSCIVDLLGRLGRTGDALNVIEEMPFEADAVIWRTLLSICKLQGEVEIAEKAATSILQLEPDDSSAYILLCNIYADAGMWDKVGQMRRGMKQNRLKKEPGCSWIEIKDGVLSFVSGDKSHSRWEEIYESIGMLVNEMKWNGYIPDDLFGDEEVGEEELPTITFPR